MWLDLGDYRGPGRVHALLGYMVERTRQRGILEAYRAYVTDALNYIPQNKYQSRRFADLIDVRHYEDMDVEDIIAHVAEVGGLEVIG